MTSPAYVSKVAKSRLRQGKTGGEPIVGGSSSDLESKCGVGGGETSVGGRRGHRQWDNLTRVCLQKKKKKK